jgi:two-component system, OmpR family, sensor histidine kinase BaeS
VSVPADDAHRAIDRADESSPGTGRRLMAAFPAGIAARIATAAVLVAGFAVGIVAVGTLSLGAEAFVHLMTADGHPADAARAMFDQSVGQVVVMALIVATVLGVALSALLGRRIARPIRDVARAARRLAGGDYAVRVPRDGPQELASLADSFNQMAESLQEQERLRREFIANAAHELRTPLTNLQGYLEALRDEVIPADRTTFESLWEEAERLVRLSRSLDVLARGDARTDPPSVVEVDVATAVRSAADLFAHSLSQAGLSLETEAIGPLEGRADPDGLAQVLGNLLQNALRYSPRGGAVRVAAQRRPDDVLVAVSNTGPAIPDADLAHVFERFYRVEKSRDAARGGAGIGLAIVLQLVESFGGQVGVESGGGINRFWFTVPVAGRSEPEVKPRPAATTVRVRARR